MAKELVHKETPQEYWALIKGNALEGDDESSKDLLLNQLERLVDYFTSLGKLSYAYTLRTDLNQRDLFFAHIITFEWAEQAKETLLLWRNSFFELQKAQLLEKDALVENKALKALEEASLQMQRMAWTGLEEYLENSLDKNEQGMKKMLRRWSLQKNPWEAYQKQFLDILAQGKSLKEVYPKLLDVQKSMRHIATIIQESLEKSVSTIISVRQLTDTLIASVASIEEEQLAEGLKSLLEELQELEIELGVGDGGPIDIFLGGLEDDLEHIPERISFVMGVQGGYLQRRDMNIRKKVQVWLESEAYPLVDEIWELAESSSNGLKMIFINIRNRVSLLLEEDLKGIDKEKLQLDRPLLAFLKDSENKLKGLKEIRSNLEERLSQYFKFAYIYDEQKEFLPIFVQDSSKKYFWSSTSDEGWLGKTTQWIGKQWEKWQSFKTKIAREQSLGVSERIVRCIQNRKPDAQNGHYTSIFMTKGYIGESFLIGRKEQLAHVGNIISNWKQGYRGAVFVTGERLSGKTLFSEIVAHRYFADNFIRLRPNRLLNVEGKTLQITYDLAEALDFIQKNALQRQALVWLDNLELWWDEQHPIYQNIQALSDWIDSYSTRLFILVNTNNTLKKQLDQLLDIDRVFQAEISMDKIGAEAIQRAIWMRHGATHKKLINTKNEDLTTQAFQRLCKRICKSASGNIGEALNIWIDSTYYIDEDHVQNDFQHYRILPYFLNRDTALILHAFLQYKRLDEYKLRKLFGPMFAQQYATIVKRMLGIGILKTRLDGELEIEELIVNDLKKMIETYH
ncbi:MAG: hypothetical protein MK212_14500 [Saprospiraceae bacterium]|nr:hypothetical protein [Saprospiraceae bacterium]